MNIQKIGSCNNIQSFKANLFYKGQKIGATIFDYDNIAERGAKNTDILVSGIESKNNGYEHENRINFTLRSPIFGERTFNVRGCDTIYNPNEKMESKKFVYDFFASIGDICKYYEDKTLEKTLLSKVNKNAKNNKHNYNSACEIDAVKILNNMLSNIDVEQEGLSDKRIKELYGIARDVNTNIAIQGSSSLLDEIA